MSSEKITLNQAITLVQDAVASIQIKGTPKELYEPIDYILQLGGKRLRPVLVCLGCDLFGGEISHSLSAAKGIEVFHNFTLVHDDIMDKASLRRGKPTVHEKWNSNIAILSGDAMLIKAYDFVLQGAYKEVGAVLREFNKAAIEVCEGQQLDMNFEELPAVSIQEYINMIRLKTSVLLGAALKIGAIVGGASKQNSELIYEFGVNVGIAFQLMDDYLDAFGDPEKFGKKVGGDIISNKKTFLFIKAMELDESGEMQHWMTLEKFNEKEKVEAVKSIYRSTKADQLCLAEMDKYNELALQSLDKITVDEGCKLALREFASFLKNRVL